MLHINRRKPVSYIKGTDLKLCLYRHASPKDITKE